VDLPRPDRLTTLLIILRAACLTGDGELERVLRRELRVRYGITLRDRAQKGPGCNRARRKNSEQQQSTASKPL
jgi:hypothetical protein